MVQITNSFLEINLKEKQIVFYILQFRWCGKSSEYGCCYVHSRCVIQPVRTVSHWSSEFCPCKAGELLNRAEVQPCSGVLVNAQLFLSITGTCVCVFFKDSTIIMSLSIKRIFPSLSRVGRRRYIRNLKNKSVSGILIRCRESRRIFIVNATTH